MIYSILEKLALYIIVQQKYIWTFIQYRDSLPKQSKIENPKMEYEILSGGFYFEDEGLREIRSHDLVSAFKYVICHRTTLISGKSGKGYYTHSRFNKRIFNIAKRFFPNWIGFEESRCTYNEERADRIARVRKVAEWKMERMFDEDDKIDWSRETQE